MLNPHFPLSLWSTYQSESKKQIFKILNVWNEIHLSFPLPPPVLHLLLLSKWSTPSSTQVFIIIGTFVSFTIKFNLLLNTSDSSKTSLLNSSTCLYPLCPLAYLGQAITFHWVSARDPQLYTPGSSLVLKSARTATRVYYSKRYTEQPTAICKSIRWSPTFLDWSSNSLIFMALSLSSSLDEPDCSLLHFLNSSSFNHFELLLVFFFSFKNLHIFYLQFCLN